MYEDVISLIEMLIVANGSRKQLGILHVDCHVMYGCDNADVVLPMEAADFYEMNITKTTRFHASSSYGTAMLDVSELWKTHRLYAAEEHPSVSYFMDEVVPAAQGPSRSLKLPFLNDMRLLEDNPREKRKRWAVTAPMRQNRLFFRLRQTFGPTAADGTKAVTVLALLPSKQL